ncbi:regulatory protein, luxR family [Actinacidiphila alni]|uniref:Regulatory protein, luxR family n=2 Tax=Actinacidiphila alni TaxID=380248 RepID=A0A1I2ITJ0_9ACTN|nr:regulatory protein, luxR family [Actinacidiphila alni]
MDAFDRAAAGHPQLLLVTGEAGLGKTRLVEEVAALTVADGRARLRLGASVPLSGTTLAYGPFVAALRDRTPCLFASGAAPDPTTPTTPPRPGRSSASGDAVRPGERDQPARPGDPARAGREDGTPGPGRAGEAAGCGPLEDAVSHPATRQRLFERMLALLADLSARIPLVLVLEDLHWADASTRDLLAFLAVRLRRQHVLIVATVREAELAADARRWFAELLRCPRVTRLRLTALADAEVAELVAALLSPGSDPADVAAAVAAAEGNPLYAEELARSGRPWPPASIAEIVLARVSCVDADVRQVIDQLSVTDGGVPHDLLAAVVPLPEPVLLAAVRKAVDQRLLVTTADDGYALPHGLIRQILYADLLPGERRRLHRRYAAALSRHRDRDPALLARHWHLADCPALAATAALTAARRAAAARAHPEAHGLYSLAVELADHLPVAVAAALWPEAARAAAHAGDPQRATEHILRALSPTAEPTAGPTGGGAASSCAPSPVRPTAQATVRGSGGSGSAGRSGPACPGGSDGRAAPGTTAAPGRTGAAGPVAGLGHTERAERARLLERLAAYRRDAGDPRGAVAALGEALELLTGERASALEARVLAAAADMRVRLGDPDGALPLAQRALRMAERTGALAEHAHALTTLGVVRAQRGDLAGGLEALGRARELAGATDSVEDVLRAASNHMYLLCTGGRFAEAREVALAGRRAAGELGAPPPMTAVLDFNTAAVLVATGRWPEADELLAELVGQSSAHIVRYLHLLQLELAVARGDPRTAAELTAVLAASPDDPRLRGPFHACLAEQALDTAESGAGTGAAELSTAADHVLRGLCAVGSGGALAEEEIRLLAAGARLAAELALLPEPLRPRGLPLAWHTDAAAFADRAAAIAARHGGEPVVAAFGALAAAEHSRGGGTDDRATWRQVADVWRAADQPYREAYARLREAGSAIRASRREQAGRALAACLALAEPLAAEPLVRLAHALAARSRLTRPPAPPAPTAPNAAARFDLTERETQVLALLSDGRSNRQIGRSLYISDRTVAVHVSHILEKLGVRNRTEAALVYARAGLAPSVLP